MLPKSLFSPGRAAHEASTTQFEELNCSTLHPISYPTQTLKLGHAAKKLTRIMKNSAECSSKDESDEIKKYSLRKRLHMSIRRRLYIRRRGVGLSRGIRFSRMVCGERLLCLLVAMEVEVKIQTGVNVSSLLLKSEPPRSPLGTGLVPQSSYNFVPLSNQSYLQMKVPTQSTTHLIQAFRRVYSLGGLTTSSVQQAILSRKSSLAARSSSLDSRSSPWDVMSSSLTI